MDRCRRLEGLIVGIPLSRPVMHPGRGTRGRLTRSRAGGGGGGGEAIATEPSQQFALGLLARSLEALKAYYEYHPIRTIGASGDPCTNRPTLAGERPAMGNHGCERGGLPCRRSAKGGNRRSQRAYRTAPAQIRRSGSKGDTGTPQVQMLPTGPSPPAAVAQSTDRCRPRDANDVPS